ncbi:MAG: SUF system NifU family Fe-S cluster assembly protein [Gammaproteobacteria bacterium]|nr:SUF system NifU family Fe-S cluster assembly protein [Gammaproteobacteria bacterium]MCP4277324.1 SUF system NifU family Fe-S cluster assembly protein [Gammaproteobacteria bacterium]MCP4831615.1 SUF system NifU family Fe-S cluster assembly protein [Gammaproteobacteria bacterium]
MNSAGEDLQAIYRKQVLEHSRNPHNQRHPEAPDCEALGFNPLCGDKLTVYANLQGDKIIDVAFEGTGCAISVASASMMTDAITGCSLTEAASLIEATQKMFSSDQSVKNTQLTEIAALEGVRSYPSRIKCATLAWTALAAALYGQDNQISTE